MKNAQDILREALVVDCHLDIGFDLELKYEKGRRNVLMEEYYDTLKAGGVDVVFAACFADTRYLPEQGLRRIIDEIARIYEEVDSSNGAFVIVKSTQDILKAREKGQIGILLAIEGVEPLGGDILALRSLYELGVRVVSLCWSRSGWAADGARFVPVEEYEGYGLTEAGREFVAYAEKLGILIDVSHCNLKSFWGVVEATKKPFMATHSNAYQLSPVARNLDDQQIRAIAERGGVIGINGASIIVNYSQPEKACLDDMGEHLLYEKKIGSPKILAVGLDQAERIGDACDSLIGKEIFDVIPTHEKMPEFVDMLIRKGFSEEEIRGILGENILDLLRRTIDKE